MKLADPALEATYAAAERFVDAALRADDSIFTPGVPIWNLANLEDLRERFVEHPDDSGDPFLTKFRRQLANAPDPTLQLAAEALFVHFLIAYMTGAAKRAVIEPVLGWMHEPLAIPPDLDAALDAGVASPGTAFHTYRPFQLAFVIEFGRVWKELTRERREAALRDPWEFKAVLFGVPMPKGAFIQREALLYLVYPAAFESIVSRAHKEAIAKAFGIDADEPDVDRRLAATRAHLEGEHGHAVDWYDAEIEPRWRTRIDVDHRPHTSRGWIFQASPDQYDLPGALESLAEFHWLVRRYEREIHTGDRVYLWEAGDDAGVVAVAEVATEPADAEESEAERAFWLDAAAFVGPRRRVLLKVTQVVDPRLSRAEAQANPVLAKLPNLVFAQGTNFPLSPEQDQELARVIGTTRDEPSALTFDALQEETGWEADRLRELADAVRFGPSAGRSRRAAGHRQDLGRRPRREVRDRYPTRPVTARPVPPELHLRAVHRGLATQGRGQRRHRVRARRRDRPRRREDDGAAGRPHRHRDRRDEPREPVEGLRRAHVPVRVPRRADRPAVLARPSRCRLVYGSSAR